MEGAIKSRAHNKHKDIFGTLGDKKRVMGKQCATHSPVNGKTMLRIRQSCLLFLPGQFASRSQECETRGILFDVGDE